MTAPDPDYLERAWAVLTRPTRADALTSYPIDMFFGGIPCRVALDRSGYRHLLVPTVGESVRADNRPSTLAVSVRPLVFDREQATYVDLACTEPDLHPEFDDVVTDVLDAVAESTAPASVALRTVDRWRRLFRSRLVRGMGARAKLGLFAELSVLSALLECSPALPVDVWRGPRGEAHDFEAPTGCVEVKGLGADAETVVIHGPAQLDVHDGRPLDLVLVAVAVNPDGTTLTELVTDLETRVQRPGELRSLLRSAGWQRQTDLPDPDAYVIEQVLRVRVDEAVPRIVRASLATGDLPDGVQQLSYHVRRDRLESLADEAALEDVVREVV